MVDPWDAILGGGMCGFIGTFGMDGQRHSIPLSSLEQALLGVRGPDEVVELADQDSFIRFYRLRLVGIDTPLASLQFSSPVHYSFLNGTIHNHREISPDSTTGHHALSTAFNRWGNNCWDLLEGSFAACVKHNSGLLLSTDTNGEKSLCWARQGAVLWYSTSPLLLAYHLRRAPRTGNATFAHIVLRGQPIGETYFTGIQQLAPGHILQAQAQGIRICRWPQSGKRRHMLANSCSSAKGMTAALAMKMTDGVAGVALSGGVDSSLLTAIGHQHAAVNIACSLAPGEDVDLRLDQYYAHRLTSGIAGIKHLDASPCLTFNAHAPRDFPVLDQDELGLNNIAKTLHDAGCNLLISGDGADELFCGYDRIFRFANNLDITGEMRQEGLQCFMKRYAYADLDLIAALCVAKTPHWILQQKNYLRITTAMQRSHFARAHHWFYRHHLFWLLRKLDFVCGCHGIENRAPFLHRGIVSLAASLTPEQLLPSNALDPSQPEFHRQIKKALKDRIGQILPEEILIRPGLAFPTRAAIAEELYLAALPEDPEPTLPMLLHAGILEGRCGRDARLHYLSHLTWMQSCQNLLN